jgi:hypothetical protein
MLFCDWDVSNLGRLSSMVKNSMLKLILCVSQNRNNTALRPFGLCRTHLGGTVKSALALWRITYKPRFGYYSQVRKRFSYTEVAEGFSWAGSSW